VKLLRPNHQNQIPASNQCESSCRHAQPVIKHPIVNHRLRTQTLQCLHRRGPTEKHSNDRNAPSECREAEKQLQKSKVHRWPSQCGIRWERERCPLSGMSVGCEPPPEAPAQSGVAATSLYAGRLQPSLTPRFAKRKPSRTETIFWRAWEASITRTVRRPSGAAVRCSWEHANPPGQTPPPKPEPTRQPKPPDSNLRRLSGIFHQHKLKFENFALFSDSLSLPLRGGRLPLGTWQGNPLWEHRHTAHTRRVTLHFLGELAGRQGRSPQFRGLKCPREPAVGGPKRSSGGSSVASRHPNWNIIGVAGRLDTTLFIVMLPRSGRQKFPRRT